MEEQELLILVRRYLGDPSGKVFADSELARMIENAVKQYSEDAGCFHGTFSFYPNENGEYKYPEDYICYLVGWNKDERNVRQSSAKEISRFVPNCDNEKGLPEFIYDELDMPGAYSLCPNPYDTQVLNDIDASDYGVILNNDYGVELEGELYGVSKRIFEFAFVGDAQYVRYAVLSEIKDHMAIVYNVLYQAFNEDTDFVNPKKALVYLQQYKMRVSMFGHVKKQVTGMMRGGNFF